MERLSPAALGLAPARARRLLTQFTLATLLLVVIAASAFVRKYFGEVTWHQLLFHLEQGGVDMADPQLFSRALRWLALTLMLAVALVITLTRLSRRWCALAWAVLLLAASLSVRATLGSDCDDRQGDYLAEHYASPAAQALLPPEHRPDILLVFFESLDEAFVRPSATGENLVPQLTRWRQGHGNFGALHNLAGASWTMAGMFAALCGVPLQAVGMMNGNDYEYASSFFEGGQCLTDLLKAQGYEISFYGGASLRFAGKGKFLAAHGVQRRFGREQWQQLGADVPERGWGLLDTDTLARAWQDMNRPRHADTPRLHIVLTVNSHGPDGAVDPGCGSQVPGAARRDPALTLRHAYRCSDAAVAQLLQRFARAGDGRAKLVWVMGDHLSHPHALTPLLAAEQSRPPASVFHAWAQFNRHGKPVAEGSSPARQFTHVDVLPTLAEAAGFWWGPDTHRLGMGVSLLAPDARRTLVERDGLARMNRRMACTSPLFASLWSRPAPSGPGWSQARPFHPTGDGARHAQALVEPKKAASNLALP